MSRQTAFSLFKCSAQAGVYPYVRSFKLFDLHVPVPGPGGHGCAPSRTSPRRASSDSDVSPRGTGGDSCVSSEDRRAREASANPASTRTVYCRTSAVLETPQLVTSQVLSRHAPLLPLRPVDCGDEGFCPL